MSRPNEKRRALWKRLAKGILLIGIAIQLVPVDRSNPAVQPEDSIYATEHVPDNVRIIFEASCSNCHSSQTRWPWYGYVAPTSWIVASDVHRGRSLMNFSDWGTYSAKKRDQKLEDICDELMNSEMPDGKYLLIHRSARLSQDEKENVCRWTQSPQ